MNAINPIMPAGTIAVGPGVKRFPARPLPDFAPYACDLSRLTPQHAMRTELTVAAKWAELAKSEGHRRGVPHMAEYTPRIEGQATQASIDRIMAKMSAFPVSGHWLHENTGLSRAMVFATCAELVKRGKIAMLPADRARKRVDRFLLATARHIDEPQNTTEAFRAQLTIALSLLAEPRTARELGEAMQLGKSSQARIIDRLRNDGLIDAMGKRGQAVIWVRIVPHAS